MIKLHTNYGVIAIELDSEKAPITAQNFLNYVNSGHYDNTLFHRVIDGFMIQGGGFVNRPLKNVFEAADARQKQATQAKRSEQP
jgi:cyclophilin family peptidyl-prolyl cis-trans isomerase